MFLSFGVPYIIISLILSFLAGFASTLIFDDSDKTTKLEASMCTIRKEKFDPQNTFHQCLQATVEPQKKIIGQLVTPITKHDVSTETTPPPVPPQSDLFDTLFPSANEQQEKTKQPLRLPTML